MRKIRLDVDTLRVESFDTARDEGKAGTVHGYITRLAGCVASEESNCATCLQGCPADTLTCAASCLWTDGGAVCKEPYC